MGAAVLAAWRSGDRSEVVQVRSDSDSPDELPVAWLLRGPGELPPLEARALELARGRILDVGAGAGAHALPLQAAGRPVTALERSAAAVEVLRARGVEDARLGDVFDDPGEERWDTVLLLMNGTTLVGSPGGLERLCRAVAGRLAPGGRALVDSVDLREADGAGARPDGRYVGEVQLQLAWRGRRTAPFPVLYADPDLLAECAAAAELSCRVLAVGAGGAYLAGLERA